MFYKVLPNKIPDIWELVKVSMQKTNNFIDQGEESLYLSELLHSLLSGKALCFVRTDKENTTVKTVVIARVILHAITKKRHLLIQNYYAFEKSSPEEWENNMKYAIEFSEKNGCEKIVVESSNPKIIALAEHFGYKERKATLEYIVGGA